MSNRFCVMTPDAQYMDDALLERSTAGGDVDWIIRRERTGAGLEAAELARVDAVVTWHEMPFDDALLRRLPRCRIVVRAGVGFDQIDLAAAAALGIPVANTPDYGTSEVADHAIAMLLALLRGIATYHEVLTADPIGGFDYQKAPLVRRIRGTTLGIVGLGRIGTATILRAKGFGLRIVGYDPYVPRGAEIALGIERAESLEALLDASDAVSLHCPLTPETRGMIGAAALARMRPGAVLVNTARGAVVDVPALIAALKAGRIAGAALDVLPTEPPRPDQEIVSFYRSLAGTPLAGRLVLSPHAAWSSPESAADARRLSVETAMLYLRRNVLRNCVNGHLPHPAWR
jgi:phosphoglycerate dehydrogenase-like enzyme